MFCSLPSVIPVKLGLEARCKALEQINEYKSVTDCNYCMNMSVTDCSYCLFQRMQLNVPNAFSLSQTWRMLKQKSGNSDIA
jgi:hypothetical protein